MKIFDAGTLQSVLDADLTWRRKDVSALIGLAQIASLSNQQSLIRASIPILYAHWEGFVRNCFVRYFELVAQRRIKFSALTFNFLFLASRSDLSLIPNALLLISSIFRSSSGEYVFSSFIGN